MVGILFVGVKTTVWRIATRRIISRVVVVGPVFRTPVLIFLSNTKK